MKKILIFFVLYLCSNGVVLADKKSDTGVENIDTTALSELIDSTPDLLLIDVRTPGEIGYLGGAIDHPGNVNIPRGWLEFRIKDSAPGLDTPIVVYCGTNVRSPLAAKTLLDLGYKNVSNYADGFRGWKKSGLPVKSQDKAPDSILYSKPVKVADGVYSAIGETGPPTYNNSGHNNNLSFVVTNDGVIVVNAGENYLLAKALHEEIKKITDKPVKFVVLENGQGHAMLGSSYWKEQGAEIIAHKDAAEEIKTHGEAILARMQQGRKDKSLGSSLVMPDKTFEDRLDLSMGGRKIVALNLGPAHSPGDILVWLPEEKLVISGDIAFHQRLLPVFEHTDTAAWIDTWDKFEALDAKVVIPGHGDVTNMEEVTKYTRDYLVFIRQQIAEIIESGGDLQDAYKIDQSAYRRLHTFNFLAKRNVGMIFRAMEFE